MKPKPHLTTRIANKRRGPRVKRNDARLRIIMRGDGDGDGDVDADGDGDGCMEGGGGGVIIKRSRLALRLSRRGREVKLRRGANRVEPSRFRCPGPCCVLPANFPTRRKRCYDNRRVKTEVGRRRRRRRLSSLGPRSTTKTLRRCVHTGDAL